MEKSEAAILVLGKGVLKTCSKFTGDGCSA